LKNYRMVSLENDQMRVKICPDLEDASFDVPQRGRSKTLFFRASYDQYESYQTIVYRRRIE